MSDRKLANLLKRTIDRATKVQRWPATITAESSRKGFTTVKYSNGITQDVMNLRLASAVGLKVTVGYDPISPGVLQILGIRETLSIPGLLGNWAYWIANHHKNHEFPGPDTVWIQGEQFLPNSAIPISSWVVRVYFSTFRGSGKWVGTGYQDVDLSDYQTVPVPLTGAIWV